MKILILPSWYNVDGTASDGIFIKQQAKALRNVGIDIEVLFLDSHYHSGYLKYINHSKLEYTNDEGLPTYYAKHFSPPKINEFLIKKWCNRYWQLFNAYLDKTNEPPDLIHAHSYTSGFAARYIAKKSAIPYVVTEHHNCFIDQSTPKLKIPLIKKVFQQSSGNIVVGKSLQIGLESFTQRRTSLIPNMIDTQLFQIAKYTKPKEALKYISVGSLEPAKGYDILIKAFHQFKQQVERPVQLEIIGSGPSYLSLQKLIQSLNLADTVYLSGEKNQVEVAASLEKSQVYCHSSFLETFGVAVAEAMSVGLPVIVTASQGPEHFVPEKSGYVVPIKDISSFSKALLKMYNNYTNFDPAKIRQHIIDHFSASIVTTKLIDFYHSILSKQ